MRVRLTALRDVLNAPRTLEARRAILQRHFDRIDPANSQNAAVEPWYRTMLEQERIRLRGEIDRLPEENIPGREPGAVPEPETVDEEAFAGITRELDKLRNVYFADVAFVQGRSWSLLRDAVVYLSWPTPREGRIAILKRELAALPTKQYRDQDPLYNPLSAETQESMRRSEEQAIRDELKTLEEQEGKPRPAK
jgi:hypothetical protein